MTTAWPSGTVACWKNEPFRCGVVAELLGASFNERDLVGLERGLQIRQRFVLGGLGPLGGVPSLKDGHLFALLALFVLGLVLCLYATPLEDVLAKTSKTFAVGIEGTFFVEGNRLAL